MNPDSPAQALFYTTRQSEGDLVVSYLSKVDEHTAKLSSASEHTAKQSSASAVGADRTNAGDQGGLFKIKNITQDTDLSTLLSAST